MRLDPSIERFDDLLQGPQVQQPSEQCGDLLVRDRNGYWTYQFAVTVDDFDQGVNLVVRGLDASTLIELTAFGTAVIMNVRHQGTAEHDADA